LSGRIRIKETQFLGSKFRSWESSGVKGGYFFFVAAAVHVATPSVQHKHCLFVPIICLAGSLPRNLVQRPPDRLQKETIVSIPRN
jgi:hypothetical protein